MLTPRMKCFWEYLCCKWDNAGVWEPDFDLATFMIREVVSEEDLSHFGERIERLPSGKYWLTSFVEFQCGKLSMECPPHARVIQLLKKHGLWARVQEEQAKGKATLSPRVPPTLPPRVEEEEEDRGVQRGNDGQEELPQDATQPKTQPTPPHIPPRLLPDLDEFQIRLGKLFGRKPTTHWDAK